MSFIYCHLNYHANSLRTWRIPLNIFFFVLLKYPNEYIDPPLVFVICKYDMRVINMLTLQFINKIWTWSMKLLWYVVGCVVSLLTVANQKTERVLIDWLWDNIILLTWLCICVLKLKILIILKFIIVLVSF